MNHFTDGEVERALAGVDLGGVLRDAFLALGRGEASQQARVRTDAGGVKLSTLGAVIPAQGVAGAKVYTTLAGQFRFLIALFSARTGEALATFDANAITRRRTAAVSVLAAQIGAREDVRSIAVYGTGVQGRAHAEAFAAVYPQAVVRVISRADGEGVAREAAATSQIIVTATRSAAPLFAGDVVAPGAFIAAVGSSRPDTRELDEALMARAAAVLVEWKEQTLREAGDIALLSARVRESLKLVELGEALAGAAPVRANPADIILFKSVGVGIEDVAVAGLAYRRLTGREP